MSLPPASHRRRAGFVAALALGSVVLAACSSAPRPPGYGETAIGPDGAAITTTDPVTGLPVTGTTAPGTAGGTTGGGTGAGTGTTTGGTGSGTGTGTGTTTGGTGSGTGTGQGHVPGAPSGYQPVDLFGASAKRGITASQITICAHAALTYGNAFGTTKEDFNVFWEALKAKGGIYGRNVDATYENDNYDPATAEQAATTCATKNPFMILGGIGFDQIPQVRNWAETHKELYVYHDATVNGSAGKRYSFTSLPSVEELGGAFADLAKAVKPNAKIGILWRNSDQWEPGHKGFKALASRYGLNVVSDQPVEKNAANYTSQLVDMKNKGVDLVWIWENALSGAQIMLQAKNQDSAGSPWKPDFMVFPFNLETQTLQDSLGEGRVLESKIYGVASWGAYGNGDTSGLFAPYADDIKLFEQQYKQYRPNTDIHGVGGDLLFLNWQAQKGLQKLFLDCGRDCDRNSFANMLMAGYHVTMPGACPVDFRTDDHHHGGHYVNWLIQYKSPDGRINFKPMQNCVHTPAL